MIDTNKHITNNSTESLSLVAEMRKMLAWKGWEV